MSKYAELDKAALVEEITKRKNEGRTIKADMRSEEKMRAALDEDDEMKELEGTSGTVEDQIPAQPDMPSVSTQPSAEVFKNGFKAKNNADGFIYQVADVSKTYPDDVKPFKARVPKQASGHPGLYWEGSEAEFKEQFSKL